MPRTATGSVTYIKGTNGGQGHYLIRCTLVDGTTWSKALDPGPCSPQAEARARERAAYNSEKLRRTGATKTPKRRTKATAEREVRADAATLDGWAARWLDDRAAAGVVSVQDDRQRYAKHVKPVLGSLPVATITKDDVRGLVAALDDRVRDPAIKFTWKTARHVWALVRGMFKDACASKRADLRVRDDDPTDKVRAPDRGDDRDRTYLYPLEFSALVSCAAVPVWRRRLYALAAYTLSRAGELRALRCEDVDVGAITPGYKGIITLRQASDRRTAGAAKRTKSGKTRRIPIESTLRPLLDVLLAEAKARGSARLVHVPESKNADLLQRDLAAAGLTRAALFPPPKNDKSNAATWAPLTFHDLRGTGVTWLALLHRDEPHVIQQRAGHADYATTQRYLREAETLGRDGGVPFPELPADLLGTAQPDPAPAPEEGPGSASNPRIRSGKCLSDVSTRNQERDTGFETGPSSVFCGVLRGNPEASPPETHGNSTPKSADASRPGQVQPDSERPVDALERALLLAAEAGRFDVVALLARELEARRLAGSNVTPLGGRRATS